MNIAITTDWLIAAGGAERVIAEMHTLWPDAPLFTTVHKPGCLPLERDAQRNAPLIHTSALQKWYALLRDHRLLLPWMPKAAESWDLRGFDVILSSSHAVAKGCIPQGIARHICYCHTPMRYAWEMEEHYLDDFRLSGPLRSFVQHTLRALRKWDRTTAKRVDLFIANSKATQERIRRFYGRESIVLHPPVDERFFRAPLLQLSIFPSEWIGRAGNIPIRMDRPGGQLSTRAYFLAVGRLVPYKRFDLLIEVANTLKLPLKIAGDGPDAARLRQMAGPTVELLGHIPDDALPALYSNSTAFLYPTYEDAGIALLEAQACGTPVVALGKGGALDTVVDRETGILLRKQTGEDLQEALQRFGNMHFDPARIRRHAERFSSTRFREALRNIVEREFQHGSRT